MKALINMIALLATTSAFAATNGTTSSTTTPNQQTKATQKEVKVKPKKWNIRYYNYIDGDATAINRGATNEFKISEYGAYVGGYYKISDRESVGVRQWFHSNSVGDRFDVEGGPTSIHYTRSKIGRFLDEDINSTYRLYLPTSANTSAANQYQARAYFTSGKKLGGKWSTSYLVNPRALTYAEPEGKSYLKLLFGGDINHQTISWMKLGSGFYMYPTWSHPGKNAKGEDVDAFGGVFFHNVSASFTITDNLSLTAYLEQARGLKSTTAYIPLNEDESYYALELFASL